MRQFLPFVMLVAAATAASAAPLTVPVDQARRLAIQGSAASVVVGNKDIADVRAIDSRTLMVVGKKAGTTNVVVLDLAGRTLFEDEIRVSAAAGAVVTIYRGGVSADYTCSPSCQSAQPGAAQANPAASAPSSSAAGASPAPTPAAAAPAPSSSSGSGGFTAPR